jgi:hypothetical protein
MAGDRGAAKLLMDFKLLQHISHHLPFSGLETPTLSVKL